LQADEFAATFDRFFANPETSPDGWETAIDTQSRIIAATRRTMADLPEGTLAVFCGHGIIGTLLKCHCGGRPIARHEEQRVMAHPGGGNAFVFDIAQPALYCDWVAMEDFDPALLG
jgi:broad specificity phosphatase PhoE